jgi:uncharacterized membrane-anchored protein
MTTYSKLLTLSAFILALAVSPLLAQDTGSKSKPGMILGPAKAKLEGIAQVDVPLGYVFLDGKSTRALLKSEGEPVSGHELGLLTSTNDEWSVFFEFSAIGYVKDDDKNKLDPDKLLADIKRGNAEANKERQRAGNPPLEIVGWEMPPKYDEATHNLEWAIRCTSQDRPILNYNTRLLGRKGVMEVVLVVPPDKLQDTLPQFRSVLAGYSFQSGQSYAEFRSGDKVAKYGLAALVVGGAAVGAAKLGLFAWLAVFLKKGWKLVVVAFAAVAAFFKRLFAKLTGRQSSGMTQQ